MKYVIESESLAVNLYMSNTGNKVISSGPWVNKNYIHLAVSPDGLIYNDQNKLHGIIEIKCLKIFRNRTIEQLILGKPPKLSKQCFELNDNNIYLNRSHLYFHQVQLQLLITEADYCDFILYFSDGKIYVERIVKDDDIQRRIIKYTKLFWEKNINLRVFYNENSKRTFTYSLIIRVTVAAKVLKNNFLYCNDFCCV